MDWQNIAFDWNRARAFWVTAEEGSLSAAARALNMTQPTLGRQVEALEQELGVALFERVGRGLVLTPSGHELLAHVRQMGNAAGRLSLAATGQSKALEGTISITATEITSIYQLPAILEKLRQVHPGVKVKIIASNATIDLKRRAADIAIRNYRPSDPDLIAKKICDMRGYFYATPGYVDQIGRPKKLKDLSKADFIGFEEGPDFANHLISMGIDVTDDNFPIIAGSHAVHWEMVKRGLGIGIVPQDVGDKEPGVERLLPEQTELIYPVWLTTHRELKTSVRVRTVFDFVADALTHMATPI